MRYRLARSSVRWALLALVATAGCGGADVRLADDAAPLVVSPSTGSGPGAERLKAGDLAGARAAFEAALNQHPDRLAPLVDLAVTYLLGGHPEAARRLLDEVVARGSAPEQQAALVNLAELYAGEGYLEAASAHLETARGIDPSRPAPWYALALLADGRGDLAGARTALREAVRLDENGATRAGFAYLHDEERVHLEALLAELAGDGASGRWRTLAQGRFAALGAAAERHLAGE